MQKQPPPELALRFKALERVPRSVKVTPGGMMSSTTREVSSRRPPYARCSAWMILLGAACGGQDVWCNSEEFGGSVEWVGVMPVAYGLSAWHEQTPLAGC